MVMLVDVSEVKDRQGLNDSLIGVDGTITSMIKGAQLRAQVEYGSEFDKQARTDVFFLDETMHGGVQPDGFFRCQLSQAFVRATPTVMYSIGATAAAGEVAQGVVLGAEKGVAYVPKEYAGKYFKIDYEAGFETSVETPDWLREVILSLVPMISQQSMPTNRTEDAPDLRKEIVDHVGALLLSKKRTVGFLLKPVF